MGIFNKIFESSTESDTGDKQEKVLPWTPLTRVDQLDTIVEQSNVKAQFIFKHSTRCSISRMVMNQFAANYDDTINADLYYLDLLNYREVSNEVGCKFKVVHQSPQLLVIKNRVVVTHASHGEINEVDLSKFV